MEGDAPLNVVQEIAVHIFRFDLMRTPEIRSSKKVKRLT